MKQINLYKLLLALTFMICPLHVLGSHVDLQRDILQLIQGKDLTIGVVVSYPGKELVNLNGDMRFPMQSIYKLPIAMAYLHTCPAEERPVTISENQLLPNTWSPFRELYPKGATLTGADFIQYVVAKSDNNLCDVMIDRAGGIKQIQRYIQQLGVDHIAIKNYEREIQSSWSVQFDNDATPSSIVQLLNKLWISKQSGSFQSELLWQVMCNTFTGSARKLLAQDVVIGYKTGFSGKNADGVTAANNCVGMIVPDHQEPIFFAIFITNSSEDEVSNYDVIAQIVKLISDLY